MEITPYLRQGVLGHRDTLGSEGTIRAGDIEVMSAGRGIRHADLNKGGEPLKLYQIWMLPRESGGEPRLGHQVVPKARPFRPICGPRQRLRRGRGCAANSSQRALARRDTEGRRVGPKAAGVAPTSL